MDKSILPHSRACGIKPHEHGASCHTNCPTCGGVNDTFLKVSKENQMSDASKFNKPTQPPFGDDPVQQAKQKVNEVLSDPNVKQQVDKGKSFYEKNKPLIIGGVVVIVVLRINKRKVAKRVAREVVKAVQKADNQTVVGLNVPTVREIFAELREVPSMRYIPHGGGAVLLPVTKDMVLGLAGEFEGLSNSEIDAIAIKKLAQLI